MRVTRAIGNTHDLGRRLVDGSALEMAIAFVKRRTRGIGVLCCVVLTACGRELLPVAPPPDVEVARPVSRDIEDWDSFNGRVTAVNAVDVRPRVSGYITQVAYREGGTVRRGDVLFIIDPRPYRTVLAAERARLEGARSTRRNMLLRFGRSQDLVPLQAISREEGDDRRAALQQSVAEVHAAEAAVARAALDLEFSRVRAPIDGRASRASQTVGNLVSADQTIMTTMVSQDPVYVDFNPDEQSLQRYRAFGVNDRHGAAFPVRIGRAGDDRFPFRGTIALFDNRVDPSTGTILARAVVANPAGGLVPGMYARVQFGGSGRRAAILIPDRAILTDQDRRYVYVLGKGNVATRRDVTPGKLIDGLRVIPAGIGRHDLILIGGLQNIHATGTAVAPHLARLGTGDR